MRGAKAAQPRAPTSAQADADASRSSALCLGSALWGFPAAATMALAREAADLLYHLLVLLKARDVPLADVMAELERRTAQTGLEEKASRQPD